MAKENDLPFKFFVEQEMGKLKKTRPRYRDFLEKKMGKTSFNSLPTHGNKKIKGGANYFFQLWVDDFTADMWHTIKKEGAFPHLSQREILGAVLLYYLNFAPEMELYRRAKEEKQCPTQPVNASTSQS